MSSVPTVVVDTKKVAELQGSIPQLVAQAQDLTISDNDDFLASGAMLDRIDARKKKVEEFFDQPAKQANAVHKWITTLRSTLLAPLQQVEVLMKNRRAEFRQAAERKRAEEEEEKRKAAKTEMEQQALREAQQMQELGETEAADAIIERAVAAPPPPVFVPSTVPKEKGKSVRKVYRYRVINPTLVKREFLIEDDSKIKAIVSRLGPDAVPIVGGIEVTQDEIEIIRSKHEQQ